MSDIEFINIAFDAPWTYCVAVIGATFFLYLLLRRYLHAGVFDPFFVGFVFAYGISYGSLLFLMIREEVSITKGQVFLLYLLVFIVTFTNASHRKLRASRSFESPARATELSKLHFGLLACSVIYFGASIAYVSKAGIPLFAEYNRFQQASGSGLYIRVTDALSPILLSLLVIGSLVSNQKRRYYRLGAILFVVISAAMSGAKISVLFSVLTVILVVSMLGRIDRWFLMRSTFLVGLGVLAALLALHINNLNNAIVEGDTQTSITGVGLVIEKFVYRVMAFADTLYMLVPEDIIDELAPVPIHMQIVSAFLGSGYANELFQIDINELVLGRQAILHHHPGLEVAGGPSTHFDLFAYHQFGISGGAVYVGVVGVILGILNKRLSMNSVGSGLRLDPILVAINASLWVRGILLLNAPVLGFAFLVEILVVWFFLKYGYALLRGPV